MRTIRKKSSGGLQIIYTCISFIWLTWPCFRTKISVLYATGYILASYIYPCKNCTKKCVWCLLTILIWLDSFPLLSSNGHEQCIISRYKVTLSHSTGCNWVFSENRRSENQFSCLFSGSLWWSWVIFRIEIKMKSGGLLPSNLPRVIDRSNLSPRRFAARW